MKISRISACDSKYLQNSIFKQTKEQAHNNYSAPLSTSKIKSENIQANFLPSFGKYRNFAYVSVTDRKSGKEVPAVIKREKVINDYFDYKLFIGNEEAGHMSIKGNSLLRERNNMVPVNTNIFPEVRALRSYSGSKYAGIGTTLIQAAIQESKNLGHKGAIWLLSSKGYDNSDSYYRKNENPIPFYYKMGFKAVEYQDDEDIKYFLEKDMINMLPTSCYLVLTEAAANSPNKYFYHKFKPAN